MNKVLRACAALGVSALGLSACGDDSSLSGRYVADFQGETMEINFIDDGKATFGMMADGEGETVDCTYQVGETMITLSCFGSSGITLTRVDGGLEANMSGVLVHYKKR